MMQPNGRPAMMKCFEMQHILLLCAFISFADHSITAASASPRLLLSETKVTGVEGAELRIYCMAMVEKPIQSLRWTALQKRLPFTQHQTNDTVSLTISSLHRSDAGTYTCMLITTDGEEETAEFRLFVRPKDRGVSTCKITQFKCKITKYCIFTRYRCDGKDDCGDGSDEDGCQGDPCAGKFKCHNSRCVDRHVVCDHDDNCGDSSDEAYCYDKKSPSSTESSPKATSSSLGLPKKTIFMVMAIIIGVVILICFIVILGCRAKMNRQRQQARLLCSRNAARHLNESLDTPQSPSQTEENSGEGQPFLLNAYRPYRNGPNIIVNVNNGVQYIPQYDCSMRPFMDAPPPYSEFRRNGQETAENAPPPYSTVNLDMTSESLQAVDTDTNSNNSSSHRATSGGGRTTSEGSVRNGTADPTTTTGTRQHNPLSDQGSASHRLESGNVISSNNSVPPAGDLPPNSYQSTNAVAMDLNLPASDGINELGYSNGASSSVSPTTECDIHEASTMQSRPRSCVVHSIDVPPHVVQDGSLSTDERSVNRDRTCRYSVPDSLTDLTAAASSPSSDRNVGLPLSDGAIEQSSSLPHISDSLTMHSSLPSSVRHLRHHNSDNSTSQSDGVPLHSPAMSNSTNRNSDPETHPVLTYPNSSSVPHEDANIALLQEVSTMSERSKPQPGHLSVRGGQIILHTDGGVLAGQTIMPTVGGAGHLSHAQGQGSDQHSGGATASHLPGEIVVKDGVIMLQIPVSQLILNRPTQLGAVGSVGDHVNQMSEECPAKHVQERNPSLSASPSQPRESSLSDHSDAGTSLPKSVGRLRGDLSIKDGQIVLEPSRHTPSSHILSHLQGAYSQHDNNPLSLDSEHIEPVVNTKRAPGVSGGGRPPFASKCNSDIVLPHAKDRNQDSL